MADFFSVQDISLCLGGRQILDPVSFSVAKRRWKDHTSPGHLRGIAP